MPDPVRAFLRVRVHRAGYPFFVGFALASLLLFAIATPLGWLGVIATLWCVYFFRDPTRHTPIRPGLVISAADGLVTSIDTVSPPAELGLADRPLPRVSVFLSIFDVHINRIPIDGTVIDIRYVPGTFISAAQDKASEVNERNVLRIEAANGATCVVVQIAGLIARRISCWVSVGQAVSAGERFGLIRFGSRVDIYLPEGTSVLVSPGQRCIAGETVIADFLAGEASRQARES